jgi:hypothetical protein
MLLALEPAPPPAADDESEERAGKQHAARQRQTWWCEVGQVKAPKEPGRLVYCNHADHATVIMRIIFTINIIFVIKMQNGGVAKIC